MTENLALGSTEKPYTLTSSDTNLPDGEIFTLPVASAYGTNDWDSGTTEDPKPVVKVNHNESHPDYGNFYNWYTAVAGRLVSGNSKQAQWSICPKNWSLITSYAGVSTDYEPNFYNLMANEYHFTVGWPAQITIDEYNRFFDVPFSFVKNGMVMDGLVVEAQESTGIWLKRTSNTYTTDNMVYYLYIRHLDEGYRSNAAGLAKIYNGRGIRCAVVAS